MEGVFDIYKKLRNLGEGKYASVYKVRHKKFGYVRAIKLCKDIIANKEDELWKTFLNECKILLQIGSGGHPNIIRIYQPQLIGDRAVVEMDYIEGETLYSYISSHFMDIMEIYHFIRDIVGALAYCHVDMYKTIMDPNEDQLEPDPQNGNKYIVPPEREPELIKKYCVIHNDIHSGNIMRRDYDGAYILLDFGLAKQDNVFVKSSCKNEGAIEYCSPEKLKGETISAASDVYSIGILLYEILAGTVPFKWTNKSDISSIGDVAEAHKNETPQEIFQSRKETFEKFYPGKEYERDYPEELENVILKCLEKNPEDRYSNAKELQKALINIFKEFDKESALKATKSVLSEQLINANSNIKKLEDSLYNLKNELEDSLYNLKNELKEKNETLFLNSKNTKRWRICTFILLVLITTGIGLYLSVGQTINENLYIPVAYADSSHINSSDIVNREEIHIRDTVIVSQNETVRIEVPKVVTEKQIKIEYRTPPETQQEIDRLLNENNKLQEEVKRWRKTVKR